MSMSAPALTCRAAGRRLTGMPELQCHFCGAPVTIGEPIPRDGECESCRGDLRCCCNCQHYDTRHNNSCREPAADPVEDKDRRNFCEYFSFNRAPFRAPPPGRASQARAGLDALFGGKSPAPDRAADAKVRLDALFRKPAPGKDPGGGTPTE
jgi:hypothetical protein